jgi:cytochrome c heme-lyase
VKINRESTSDLRPFGPNQTMGNAASTAAPPPLQQPQVGRPAGSGGGGASACPVISASGEQQAAAAAALLAAAANSGGPSPAEQEQQQPLPSSACPVLEQQQQQGKGGAYRHPHIYNVYSQRIDQEATATTTPASSSSSSSLAAAVGRAQLVDPRNRMPLEPNQEPCPGQRRPLDTSREASTIPKGGTASTWVYPSPQMFFNALRRKGKGADIQERQMDSVVRAHNAMNEATWRRVEAWEALHCDTCPHPTLLRFLGRPHDLSPLARARIWLGDGAEPFDRHDWTVDRCGEEVRYVIDFYHHDDQSGTPQGPFEIVARPALDSAGALVDRARMAVYVAFARLGLPCPVTGSGGDLGAKALEAMGAVSAAEGGTAPQR